MPPASASTGPGQVLWTSTNWATLNGGFQLAVAEDGWVYALEARGHQVTVFDPSGYRKQSFGTAGSGPGQFDFFLGDGNYQVLGGIAVSGDAVYVADESGRVQQFDRQGRYVDAWDKRGSGPGKLQQPTSMVADARGRIWVADAKQNTVQGFSPDGKLVGRVKVQIKQLLKSMCVDDEGFVYVADELGVIYKYSPAGKRVASFGTPSNDDGTYEDGELSTALKGMACQTGDVVYVSDTMAQEVHAFTKAGKFVSAFPGGDGGIGLGPDNTLVGAHADLGTISKWRLR